MLLLVGDAGEVYVEVVRGLGETLVGGSPGTPLRFSAKKGFLTEEATAAANEGLPQDCIKVHGLLSCDPARRFLLTLSWMLQDITRSWVLFCRIL